MNVTVLRPAGGTGDVICVSAAVQGLVAQGHTVTLICLPEYRWLVDASPVPFRYISVEYGERRGRDMPIDPMRYPYLRKAMPTDRFVDEFCPAYVAEKKAVRASRPPKSRVRSFCEAAGVEPRAPSLIVKPEWKAWADGWLAGKTWKRGPLVVIQPYATNRRRSWPSKQWATVVAWLRRQRITVVGLHSCYGPRPERAEASMLGLGAFPFVAQSWEHVLGLVSLADLVVTVDSAALHIAAALRKPTLGVFGPTDGLATCELYPTVVPIRQPPAPCRACYLLSDTFRHKCFGDPGRVCERLPEINDVLAAIAATGATRY